MCLWRIFRAIAFSTPALLVQHDGQLLNRFPQAAPSLAESPWGNLLKAGSTPKEKTRKEHNDEEERY